MLRTNQHVNYVQLYFLIFTDINLVLLLPILNYIFY